MKKTKTILLAIIVSLLAVIAGFGIYYFYKFEIKTYPVGKESSPDGDYTLIFEQIGDPDPFVKGIKAKITLKNSNQKEVEKSNIIIDEDSERLTERNWGVFWTDKSVEISIAGKDDDINTVTFDLN